jgi:hypothetical protein
MIVFKKLCVVVIALPLTIQKSTQPIVFFLLTNRRLLHSNERAELLQLLLPDPFHMREIIDRSEAAVAIAVLDDALGIHRADPR